LVRAGNRIVNLDKIVYAEFTDGRTWVSDEDDLHEYGIEIGTTGYNQPRIELVMTSTEPYAPGYGDAGAITAVSENLLFVGDAAMTLASRMGFKLSRDVTKEEGEVGS
jgi:hypothetical protein